MSKSRQKELGHKHKNNKEGERQEHALPKRVVAYQQVREKGWYPEKRVIVADPTTPIGQELLTTPIPEPGTKMRLEDLRRLGLLDDDTTPRENRRANHRRL
jgi:hypothetical protein